MAAQYKDYVAQIKVRDRIVVSVRPKGNWYIYPNGIMLYGNNCLRAKKPAT